MFRFGPGCGNGPASKDVALSARGMASKGAGKEKPSPEEHRTLGSVVINPKLVSRQVLKRMCDDLDSVQAKYEVMSQVKLHCDPSDDELGTACCSMSASRSASSKAVSRSR